MRKISRIAETAPSPTIEGNGFAFQPALELDIRSERVILPTVKTTSKSKAPHRWTARNADRHALYELAVQTPDDEVRFFDRVYRSQNGRPPTLLREDFCATGAISRSWVKRGTLRRAVAIDLDPEPIAWAKKHRIPKLTPDQASRLTFVRANVLNPGRAARGVDVVSAGNFSWWVFKDRDTLRKYFRTVRASLAPGGIFVLDIMGGTHSSALLTERRRCKGFTYEWDQHAFNSITHDFTCFINFIFRDGSRMDRAFRYDWRLWSIPEARELLAEAGFSSSTVYWEGDDENGGGNGIYRPSTNGESCQCHVTYIVANK
jgi:SAM-dependent methyltransferase